MKNNGSNSCMDLLFKYYSPLIESNDLQNNSPKKEIKIKTMGFKFDNNINFDDLECQNFNLNGNYKRIYYYKDDDDTESMTNPNESFDLKNFSFIDFIDEKNSNLKEKEKEKENNIESINKLSNNIKKDIIAKENKKKKKNDNKNVKKSNKGNSSSNVLNYNQANDDKNEGSKNEMESMSINNSVNIINESKLNNKSKVTLSQKNNNNKDKDKNNKPTNLKLINKTERKNNHYKSMDKLNSIIEDYYKSKVKLNNDKTTNNNNNNVLYTIKVNNNDSNTNNVNNNINNSNIVSSEKKINETNINDDMHYNKNLVEDDINNSSYIGPGLVRVTYSSSCDNKKIRSSSAFKGAKITVFQHFNRKHTVNNYYRDN